MPETGICLSVLVGDPANEKEWSKLEEINDQIVTRAIEIGGTCTGEHGIGIGKRKFMELEHGQSYHQRCVRSKN